MEEEIQSIKQFKNIDEAIKVYEEFRRFKNDGFISTIDPDFFFNLMDYILKRYKELEEENAMLKKAHNISEKVTVEDITQVMNKSLEDFKKEFIPTSVIQKKIEELKNSIEFYQNFPEDYMAEISINVLQEILEEGRK